MMTLSFVGLATWAVLAIVGLLVLIGAAVAVPWLVLLVVIQYRRAHA